MRNLRTLVVALLAFGVLAAVAPGAGAATGPSPQFCAAYAKIGTGSSGSDPTQMVKFAGQFQNAGKYAPTNVKNAANTIAKVLKQIKTYATSVKDLNKFYSTKDFRNYGKAVTTFYVYAADCSN